MHLKVWRTNVDTGPKLYNGESSERVKINFPSKQTSILREQSLTEDSIETNIPLVFGGGDIPLNYLPIF